MTTDRQMRFRGENAVPHEVPRRPISPSASVAVHRRLSRALFLGVAGLLLPAAWIFGAPYYLSEGAIYVSPHFTTILEESKEFEIQSNTQYREFVQQQVRTLTRFDVELDALKSLGPRISLWKRPSETVQESAERLESQLIVTPVPDTYLVTVGLKGGKPEGLDEIVNAVIDTYIVKRREDELHGWDERVQAVKSYRQELTAEIASKTKRLNELYKQHGATAYEEMFSTDRASQMSNMKSPLKVRRAELMTELAKLTPEHPGYPALQAEIHQLDEQIARYIPAPTANQEAVGLQADIVRAEERLKITSNRIEFFTVEARSPGMVWVSSPARRPDMPQKGKRKILLVVILLLAWAMSVAGPVAVDFFDTRIYSAGDVHRVLGFPPLGWIPDREGWPDFVASDQMRRCSLALLRQRQQHGKMVFTMTAVRSGSGTTTAALGLGKDLTALGVSVAVIEANAFNPDDRYPPGTKGLASVLAKKTTLGSALIKGAKDGTPDILPLGAGDHTAAFAPVDEFAKVLESLQATHDVILIDAPPLLLAPDAAHLVMVANATLLIVESGDVLVSQLQEAVKMLEKLDPPAAGTIVNRVGIEHGRDEVALAFREHMTKEKTPLARFLHRWMWS